MLTAAVCMRVIGFTGSRDRSLLLFLVAVIIVLEDIVIIMCTFSQQP